MKTFTPLFAGALLALLAASPGFAAGNGLSLGTGSGGGGGGGAATIADGADVAQGSRADTAYAGSGNATVISALKGAYAQLVSILTQVTSTATSNGAINTATGTQADTAYAGSGSASIIAALKGIYAAINTGTVQTGSNATPATQTLSMAYSPITAVRTGTGSAEACRVVKASAGYLESITIQAGATNGYFFYIDGTSATPTDGTVDALWAWPVPANTSFHKDWAGMPAIPATNGVTVCFSSTAPPTLTKSATARFWAQSP